jgi:uncharacterized membrane protein
MPMSQAPSHSRLADFVFGFIFLLFLSVISIGAAQSTESVTLAWNPNPETDIAGYRIIYGTTSGSLTQSQTVGTIPNTILTGLVPGATYYCAVIAFNTSAYNSISSAEVSFTVPKPALPEIALESPGGDSLVAGEAVVSLGTNAVDSNGPAQNLTILNLGAASLDGLAITMDGVDARNFSITSQLPVTTLACTNGSFEAAFTGWAGTGNVRVVTSSNAAAGKQYVEFNSANTSSTGVVSQSFATIPGTTYSLAFDVGVVAYNNNQQKLQATVTGTSTLLSKLVTVTGAADGSTRWSPQNSTFVANSDVTTLVFTDISTTSDSIDLCLDDIRIAVYDPTAVPSSITTIPAGNSSTVQVAFNPESSGTKTAYIHVISNDPDENPFDLTITAQASGLPHLSVSKQSSGVEMTDGFATVQFSDSNIGTSTAEETLIIRNTGNAVLSNLAMTVDGTNTADFVVAPLQKATLAAGDSTTVRLLFKPGSAGTKTAALRISSSDAERSPFDIQLVGNGIAVPEIAVQQADGSYLGHASAQVDMGVLTLRSSASQQFTIRNTGSGNLSALALTKSGTHSTDFTITPLDSTVLAPGASSKFSVTFAPSSAGLRNATLRLTSNDPNFPTFEIGLSGSGVALPEIGVSRGDGTILTSGSAPESFGNTILGAATQNRSFVITNFGTATLGNLALLLSGSHPGDFIPSGLTTTSLAPGASTTIQLNFRPSAAGARTAKLEILSSDAVRSPFSISLAGTGIAIPELTISQSDGTLLPSGSGSINWGNFNLSAPVVTRSLTITNSGTASLTNLGLLIDGAQSTDFTASGLTSTTLAPGATATFQLKFRPSTAGSKSATLRVSSNDPSNNPYSISLSGIAIALPEIALESSDGSLLTTPTATLSFGKVNLGYLSGPQTIRIKNVGTANLTGIALALGGANSSQFLVTQPAVSTLAPGSSTTFTVTFKPTSDGVRSATIVLASNDEDENPIQLTLTGTGSAVPVIAVDVNDLTFETTRIGSSASPRTVVVRNLGTANLTNIAVVSEMRDFTVSQPPQTTLPPGSSTEFQVEFKPTIAGTLGEKFRITSNDENQSAIQIAVSGSGLAFPKLAVSLSEKSLTQNSTVHFGEINLGSAGAAKIVTLENIGTAPLTGITLALEGAHLSDFILRSPTATSLAPGAKASFKVSLKPNAAGSRSASAKIVSNDPDNSAFEILLEGSGRPVPILAIEQNGAWLQNGVVKKSMGRINLGSASASEMITLKNVGTATLTGLKVSKTGNDASDFHLTHLTSTSIEPGESASIKVIYEPSSGGDCFARLQFGSDDRSTQPVGIALTGSGVPVPRIAVSDRQFDFGDADIGTTGGERTITIRNTGTARLLDVGVSIVGANPSSFSTGGLRTTSLAPGATTTIKVRFEPNAAGVRTALLRISSNDNPYDVRLSGTGIEAPEIKILMKGAGELQDEDAFINFGNVKAGNASRTRTFTIINRGTARLGGLKILKNGLHPGDFLMSKLSADSLVPGASCTFKVTFKPKAGGTRWGAIHIMSNDKDESRFDIVLTGGVGRQSARSSKSARARDRPAAVAGMVFIAGKRYRTLTMTWPEGQQRDKNHRIEVSPNLTRWFSGPRHTTILSSTANMLKVRDNIEFTPGSKRYIRLTRKGSKSSRS